MYYVILYYIILHIMRVSQSFSQGSSDYIKYLKIYNQYYFYIHRVMLHYNATVATTTRVE